MRRLPEGYTALTHIESTGEQALDTEFKPNQNTRVVLDFEGVTESSSVAWRTFFGACTNYSNKDFSLWYNVSGTPYLQDYYANNSALKANLTMVGRKIIEKNRNKLIVDGQTVVTQTASTFQCAYSLYLFGVNKSGALDNYIGVSGKLYGGTIYDNDVLARDYAPCLNEINIPGLYDFVTEKFYGSIGAKPFIAGEPVVSVSLGALFALRRMMTTIKWKSKYVWAVYEVVRKPDESTATTGQEECSYVFGITPKVMASKTFDYSDGIFTLQNATSIYIHNAVGYYVIDFDDFDDTNVTSGGYLYLVTKATINSTRSAVNIDYKRYSKSSESRGDVVLYEVESNTLDYPVNGAQDGLWYELIEGEV